MASHKQGLESLPPQAEPKQGGLLGRRLDRTAPADHQAFVDARASGLRAVRRSLEKRRKAKGQKRG